MKTIGKCSLAEYHRLVEEGILAGRPVELIGGEIIEMSPETPIHYATAKRGAKYLAELLSGLADVRFNGPITLPDSEPEPDLAIVRLPESAYNDRHPLPQDIFWLIEVAKTSLKTDLEIKAKIYATAGIPEYWVIDLVARQVIVCRYPQAGNYTEKFTLATGSITPLGFPDIPVSLERLLP
jgi:Uma2 family endonuclease